MIKNPNNYDVIKSFNIDFKRNVFEVHIVPDIFGTDVICFNLNDMSPADYLKNLMLELTKMQEFLKSQNK